MASIGHGISDAVRNHIPTWIDDPTLNILYEAYHKAGGVLSRDGVSGFRHRVRESNNWKRKSRKTTASGYERLYQCKIASKATLIVHSPESDMSANSYVFCIDGVPVAGGKTKLKSVQVSTVISKDKTSARPHDVQFVKFTEDELTKMRTEMRFGDGFAQLELERGA